jgi:hypothetical protein
MRIELPSHRSPARDRLAVFRVVVTAGFVALAGAAASSVLPGCGNGHAPVDQAPPVTPDLATRDLVVLDLAIPDLSIPDLSMPDLTMPDLAGPLCGDAACAAGNICIRGRCAGCCDIPPSCIPIPSGCSGALACGCFTQDPCGGCTSCGSVEVDGIHCVNCRCLCAAPWTPIATPDGSRPIATLRVGDAVYSVHRGRVVVVPVARTHRTPASRHAVVRVALASGETLEISGGHPTGDGRAFDTLKPGDRLGEAQVVSVETAPYGEPFTYDILPASDTGSYFAAGAWVGSTLR